MRGSIRMPMMGRVVVAWMLSASWAVAQVPLPKVPAQESAPAAGLQDPYHRETPRSAMLGLLGAVNAGRCRVALQFLQLTEPHREARGRVLCSDLRVLFDRAFLGRAGDLSNRPEGSLDDGLPPDQERAGRFTSEGAEVEVTLERVTDPRAGPIWLLSSETLARVPEIYAKVGVPAFEPYLPEALVEGRLLSMPLWLWVGALLAIPVAAAGAWILVQAVLLPGRIFARLPGRAVLGENWKAAGAPVVGLVALLLHRLAINLMGAPLIYRVYYGKVIGIAFIFGSGWLLWRLLDRAISKARDRFLSLGQGGAISLLTLLRRVLKVVVIMVALLSALAALGFEMSTALAGLGIGGIAIALAAQKTIENFFGGVSLLADRAIHIGDVLRIGERYGVIEDIGLRSTRLRMAERSLLIIPNGTMASMNLENVSQREKILFTTILGVRHETSAAQLRALLDELRRLLAEHPKVETEGARVCLSALGESSLNIEVYCYILSTDFIVYAAVREELLLRMIDLVEAGGSGFAFPSRTLYLARDRGLNSSRSAGPPPESAG